jgi:pSer/pThr/pTyr-binding forkhead associated (FHA) protein
MAAIKNIKPSFFGTSTQDNPVVEKTITLKSAKDSDATLATVMMTQLHDTRLETQFNRLLLMGQNDKVIRSFPLNRSVTHIGRSRSNPVRIKDPLISVKHLTVSINNDACVANDLDSSNGTFINGERLVGGRVLKDGDEMMLGKTILRFAARQTGAPGRLNRSKPAPVVPFYQKRSVISAAAMVCVAILTAFIYMGAHHPPERTETKAVSQPMGKQAPNRGVLGEPAAASATAAQPQHQNDIAPQQIRHGQRSHIQRALADYAAGRLNMAMQTLRRLTMAAEITPEAGQARSILSLLKTVQVLHVQALQAQKEKKFATALESWDRLLAVDMELVGERASFFAKQAEQKVQTLSYEHALDAYRSKNHKKVKQLCRVILQINPKHPQALKLLAKVNSKA